jgi:hypothetical protein
MNSFRFRKMQVLCCFESIASEEGEYQRPDVSSICTKKDFQLLNPPLFREQMPPDVYVGTDWF